MTDRIGVAILGCGLIGQKRAKVLKKNDLLYCIDIDINKARQLASQYPGSIASSDWSEALNSSEVQIVIVATSNESLTKLSKEAVSRGKHVLVEKPAGRNSSEVEDVYLEAQKTGALVRVGFNHRYHPALLQAKKLVNQGELGDLMFIRGRYGHGGRIGYDKEWRANPKLSGGGELIDQGVHLIDLSRWFMGDFAKIDGFAHTYYWNMPVDDNGFMTLRTPFDQTAFLQVSCTEWKNMFSFEIYGKNAKLAIDGLGGSYGVERLAFYKMLPQMGPPETTIWEYPMGDNSWKLEFDEFVEDIRLNRTPSASLKDAIAALKIVEKIYQDSGYDYHA